MLRNMVDPVLYACLPKKKKIVPDGRSNDTLEVMLSGKAE
jgi:hypothetical protein